MRPILKIGIALVILLAVVQFMGMRAEQTSLTIDMENDSCPVITSEGPQGITTAGVVVTYGPASTLFEIGDFLRRRWRQFTRQPREERSCPWIRQSPSKF